MTFLTSFAYTRPGGIHPFRTQSGCLSSHRHTPSCVAKFGFSQLPDPNTPPHLITNKQLESTIAMPSLRPQIKDIQRRNAGDQDELPVEDSDDKDDRSTSNDSASTSTETGLPQYPDKSFNRRIALLAVFSAVGLFASSRLDLGVSLKDLSAAALPYEQALSNGKPTVVEFYADWCEVCRELAPDVYKVEQQYKDRVNFVMLNVDNTKWEQELDEFGVEGIPHFAFLDGKGNEEGNVVGKLPSKYLIENVDALAQGKETIPHARVVGQYSSAEARKVHQVSDPRSHG